MAVKLLQAHPELKLSPVFSKLQMNAVTDKRLLLYFHSYWLL